MPTSACVLGRHGGSRDAARPPRSASGAGDLADGAPLGHHDDAVGERQHLRQIGGDHDQRDARGRRRLAQAGGRSRSGRRRRRRASARRRSAPWARPRATSRSAPSAGCRRRGCRPSWRTAGRRDARARRRSAWRCASAAGAARGHRAVARPLRSTVTPRRCRRCLMPGNRPEVLAVLRHHADPRPLCPPSGRAEAKWLAAQTATDPPVSPGAAPMRVSQNSVRPGADQAGEADDLARAAR